MFFFVIWPAGQRTLRDNGQAPALLGQDETCLQKIAPGLAS